jgi:micrococcal nuclease
MKRLLTTALLMLATGCSSQLQTPVSEQPSQTVSPATEASAAATTSTVAQNELPRVVSTGDGDTLRLRQGGKTITVRLGCIDAPESTQAPWGAQSANRLKQLLPAGQAVQVREIERDRYGRTVAELYLGNQSVNLRMVKEGQAVVYTQYLSGCANTQDQYLAAEAQAKAQRLGFWNQTNPVMPWDYRRGKRSNNRPSTGASPRPQPKPSTAASPTQTTSTANLPACTKSDCDCKDFKTQAEAQQVLDAFPGDPYKLDGNKDGKACESLP